MRRVLIIIPAHNEEKRIGRMLEKYCEFFREKKEIVELLVVLNACTDNTLSVVKEFQNKFKEINFLDFEQGGKGFAIMEGFKEALKKDFELIGFVDADMATPPNAFYGLIRHIKNADGVIANRWDKRSKVSSRTFVRKVLSKGGNFIIRSLFFLNHRDTQCGAKLFRKDLIVKVLPKLGASEWSFDVDFLFYARREKVKIKSIPTEWHDEKGSNINLKKTPITVLLSVIRLRLIHSPFNFIVRIYRKLPEKWKFH